MFLFVRPCAPASVLRIRWNMVALVLVDSWLGRVPLATRWDIIRRLLNSELTLVHLVSLSVLNIPNRCRTLRRVCLVLR